MLPMMLLFRDLKYNNLLGLLLMSPDVCLDAALQRVDFWATGNMCFKLIGLANHSRLEDRK